MSQTAEQVLASALYELIDRLTDVAHPPPAEPRGEAYRAELLRRSAEMDAGRTVFTPWREVLEASKARRSAAPNRYWYSSRTAAHLLSCVAAVPDDPRPGGAGRHGSHAGGRP